MARIKVTRGRDGGKIGEWWGEGEREGRGRIEGDNDDDYNDNDNDEDFSKRAKVGKDTLREGAS